MTFSHFSSGEGDALAGYGHIFIIDTNTRMIRGTIVSVCCIAVCHALRLGSQISLQHVQACAFEFHGISGAQERFAWTLLQDLIVNSIDYRPDHPHLLISDHGLGVHDAINDRREPLYGDQYLAPGLTLGFATSESGSSAIQKLIRQCDRNATAILKDIATGKLAPWSKNGEGERPGVRQICYSAATPVSTRLFRLWERRSTR